MKKITSLSVSLLLLIVMMMILASCSEKYTYYDASIELNGGSLFNYQSYQISVDSSGQMTDLNLTPYKEGHDFVDWYLDEVFNIKLTSANLAKMEGNITIYAKWEPYPIYTVSFILSYGITETKEYERNSTIDYFNPKLPLYMFQDWYSDSNLDNKWDRFTDKVDDDITLYAKWEIGLDYSIADNEVTIIGFRNDYYDKPEILIIPSSIEEKIVTGISEQAFRNESIVEVTIPYAVTYIGEEAFMFCSSLEKVEFHETSNIYTLPKRIFYGCVNLVEVILPYELMVIDDYAFQDCSSLTSIQMPYNLKRIGFGAFQYCYSLTNIDFGSNPSISEIDNQAFSYCTSLTRLNIPYTVVRIGDSAFSNCTAVTEITFNTYDTEWWGPMSQLRYLGYNAFNNVSIDSVVLPLNIEEIGSQVFNNCADLTTIYCMEESRPDNWSSAWNYETVNQAYFYVVWGHTP